MTTTIYDNDDGNGPPPWKWFLHCFITDGAVSCDNVITRDEVITSPGHPGRYPPNQVCLYRIQVSTL